MAFHPDWPARAEVYVSYTETSSPLRSVIARYRSTDNGQTFDLASEERLLTLEQPYNNHNGGNLAFGPDGFLYIGFGDGGSGGDPLGAGQRLDTNLGKFLRIDVNAPAAQRYAIPPTNPYAGDVACNRTSASTTAPDAGTRCAEIYAVGFRNPWRWSFDRVSGELWVGDVGQGTYEEVDRVVLGGNYGWRIREGAHCYGTATCAWCSTSARRPMGRAKAASSASPFTPTWPTRAEVYVSYTETSSPLRSVIARYRSTDNGAVRRGACLRAGPVAVEDEAPPPATRQFAGRRKADDSSAGHDHIRGDPGHAIVFEEEWCGRPSRGSAAYSR